MMDTTFTRAVLGFVALTAAIATMSGIALWAVDAFGGGRDWISLLIIVVALVAEIGTYMSTLHDPIYEWIREPKRKAEEAEWSKRQEELNSKNARKES